MLKVKILKTRWNNGRPIYAAGSIVEMKPEKARFAAANGWAEILPTPTPKRRTATSKKAESRTTATTASKSSTKSKTTRRKTKRKTTKKKSK